MENRKRLIIYDTNVFLHDKKCLFAFPCSDTEENHILLSQPVFNELDNKKRDGSVGYISRYFTQQEVKHIVKYGKSLPVDDPRRVRQGFSLLDGMPINIIAGKTKAKYGKFYLSDGDASELNAENKGDAKIIQDVIKVKEDIDKIGEKHRFYDMDIVFVTNDGNCFINAINHLGRFGISVEFYKKNRVERPFDALYDYKLVLNEKKWNYLFSQAEKKGIRVYHKPDGSVSNGTLTPGLMITLPYNKSMTVRYNQHVIGHSSDSKEIHGIVKRIDEKAKTFTFRILVDYTKKNNVFKLNAKDSSQNFALNILLDTEISCVAILGEAGSGKTLLSLAAAYHFIFDKKEAGFTNLYVTREPISASNHRDLGYLKGGLIEKYGPWMAGIYDNMDKIVKIHNPFASANSDIKITASPSKAKTSDKKDSGANDQHDNSKSDIQAVHSIESLSACTEFVPPSFLRGRSIHDGFIICEETQNETPEQVLTLITRVAEGTKIIFAGNTSQIDDPHLSAETCGLTHITKLLGNPEFAMVYIEDTFRSKLATLAIKLLQ